MVEAEIAPFAVRVECPGKLPSREVITNSIHLIKKRLKYETDPDKRYRLKTIRRELSRLRQELQ